MVMRSKGKVGGTFKDSFTLVEVLIVLLLISLTFSILFFSFSRIISYSLHVSSEAERIKGELMLFWELTRAFTGARKFLLQEGRKVFLLTSGGSIYRGLVKKAFIYKDGSIYTYEFPYGAGSLDFFEEEKLLKLLNAEDFRVYAIDKRGRHKNYEGLPPLVIVELGERKFTFKIR